MNKNQENKLSMYLAVQRCLTQHQTVWNTLPIATTLVNQFNTALQNLQNTARTKAYFDTSAGELKRAARQTMTDKAFTLMQTLLTYASINNDTTLSKTLNYTSRDFRQARDTQIKVMVEVIRDKANAYLSNLRDYGISANTITDLNTAITAYRDLISKPLADRTEKKQINANLKNLFSIADDLLRNKLDRLLMQFNGSTFYTVYVEARRLNK